MTIIFDYVVSNPPYQKTLKQGKNKNGITINIFDKLHYNSILVSTSSVMIYPAGRWWYDTKSVLHNHIFYNKLLNNLIYWDSLEARKVFPTVSLADGINIVSTETSQNTYSIQHNDIIITSSIWDKVLPIKAECYTIAEKISNKIKELDITTLHDVSNFMQNQAKISSGTLKKLNLEKYNNRVLKDNELKIYANASGSIAGKSDYYIIDKKYVKNYDETYQVCFGQSIIENSKRKWRVFLFDNQTVYGNSAVILFKTKNIKEAKDLYKYAQTPFFEYCLRLTIEGRKKVLGNIVPILDNTMLDYNDDISKQLYELFELEQDEIKIIEGSVIR